MTGSNVLARAPRCSEAAVIGSIQSRHATGAREDASPPPKKKLSFITFYAMHVCILHEHELILLSHKSVFCLSQAALCFCVSCQFLLTDCSSSMSWRQLWRNFILGRVGSTQPSTQFIFSTTPRGPLYDKMTLSTKQSEGRAVSYDWSQPVFENTYFTFFFRFQKNMTFYVFLN